MKFSIGYNYDIKTLELLDIYKDSLEAFYFPIPQQYLGSGRKMYEPKSYVNQISKIIKKCKSLNITSQLLLNATCEGNLGLRKDFFETILSYIKRLRDEGLESVVVTNPIYISKIRKEINGIRIETSVNCYVRTVEHALYLKDLGVDVLTVDRDINRNISLIKKIKKKTGLKIRIMLNEGCLSNCPYRISHYNYLSHRDGMPKKPIEGIFLDAFCIELYLKNPLKVFRVPFIPPEAVSYYDCCVDYYKLSTRVFSVNEIESCLKSYINGHFSGNLLEILDCPGLSYFEYIDYDSLKRSNFFEKMLKCTLNCDTCNYCSILFKKAVLIRRNNFSKRSKEEEYKAIRMYKNDLKISSGNNNKIQDYLKIGKAYFKLGKHKEAIENIKKALKLNYKGRGAYSILGFCYEALGNYKEAVKALLKEEKINPKDKSINLALGRCYRKTGRKRLFDEEMDKIVHAIKKSK